MSYNPPVIGLRPPPCAPSNLGIYPPAQADVIIIILALSPW